MTEQMTGRRHSFAEGRTERTERMVRTFYPDGTSVDSEPIAVEGGAVSMTLTWAGLAATLARVSPPPGTRSATFVRNVVIEAGPWAEVVPDDPQHGAA
jgi:hypothetical protein